MCLTFSEFDIFIKVSIHKSSLVRLKGHAALGQRDEQSFFVQHFILHIIKHKTKKSDVTLYLRNERADLGICHKQNM